MGKLTGDVQLFRWDGGCAFIGSAPGIYPVHAHQPLQISCGMTGQVRLRSSDHEPWTSHDLAIVPFRYPHAFDAIDIDCDIVLFVEPETREGRALTERYLQHGIASIDNVRATPAIAEMFAAFLGRRGETIIVEAMRRVVRELTQGVEGATVSDERVLRAIQYINARLNGTITLDEVAAEVCLSPGRFRHRFAEQTGMGLRPYVLWRRFMHVWQVIMNGASLAHAAHEAGFADAAHLSRTSRQMIGVAPSAFRVSTSPVALTSRHADLA